MDLTQVDKGSFFTLNQDGFLIQVEDQRDRAKWFRKIIRASSILKRTEEANRIAILYRGESREYFYLKTGTQTHRQNPYYDRFFVIGSKAKTYLINDNRSILDIEQFDRITKIDYICDRLSELSNTTDYSYLLTEFHDPDFRVAFKNALLDVQKRDDQIALENYYLAFIHTKSSEPIEMQAHSVLLSSTRDYSIAADSFANNGFVIVFWLANPITTQAIDYKNLEFYNSLALQNGLPSLDIVHFPDESEVTVFSAIFPQNIFYVYDIVEDKYIFNPYLIETDLRSLLKGGINVDQTLFNDYVRGVYSRSIWRRNARLIREEHQ